MPDQLAGATEASIRRWPVRLILVAIVFALVLPGLVFCGVLIERIASSERAHALESANATAQRTADMLDREIGDIASDLTVLGTSPSLDGGNLSETGFAQQVHAAARALGLEIVLCDTAGQQLVNSREPQLAPLPVMGSLDTVRRVVSTGKLAVSALFRSASEGQPALAVMVPVIRDSRVAYVLATNIKPSRISDLLHDQKLPEGWLVGVTDSADIVFARSPNNEHLTGQPASADYRMHAVGDHAAWTGLSLEGTPVLAVMQRQVLADWRVGVGVSLDVVEAPLRTTVLWLAVTGSATLVIAIVLAWQLAHSVAAPLDRLARASNALARGLPILGVRSSIAEVDAVSRALVQATLDLRARADALAAERAQLAAVIETVPIGLLIAEAPSGRVIAGNGQLDRVMRHPLRLSTNTDEYDEPIAFHADGRPVEHDEFPLARALKGEAQSELQCNYQRGDGTSGWVQLVAAPIRASDGSITGAVVAALDIDEAVRARDAKARFAESLEEEVAERTAALQDANQRLRDEMAARAAAEEQLRQAQKMEAVGQLTGGIAHDFNNLLTIIVGSLDLLRRRTPAGPDGDRARRLVDNALDGSARAAGLTSRLLAFSRRQPLSPQPVDANQLVRGMVDLLHRTLGETVEVNTILASGLWQTHADPNQLENALLNLAVNARDAMLSLRGSRGVLTIETANAVLDQHAAIHDVAAGDYIRLAVSDTGIGMTEEVARRVFEPFYTTKPPGQGTGLGLSQVHGFVKQSGGHVVISTAPGAGTSVIIYLPRFVGTAIPVAPAAPCPPEGAPLTGLTVLVVEDEAAVRRYSTEAMRELGHTVLEAADPAAALRLLDAHPEVSLLFTDVILPQMDGQQLATEVCRRRPGLPVLFTSGYTGDGDGFDMPAPGSPLLPGSLLLPKPYTLEALAAKLHEAMRAATAAS